MPLTPLKPLPALKSLKPSFISSGGFEPISYGNNSGFGNPIQFGSGGGCDPYVDFGCLEGGFGGGSYGFIPATGPTIGGNFPGDCDPSTDPCGCDPCCGDPNCGGGGGGVILVGDSSGNACGCGFPDIGCRINCTLHGATGGFAGNPQTAGGCGSIISPGFLACWLERLVILVLGIAAIWGGIYLLKPAIATAPIRAVKRGATAAAIAA